MKRQATFEALQAFMGVQQRTCKFNASAANYRVSKKKVLQQPHALWDMCVK